MQISSHPFLLFYLSIRCNKKEVNILQRERAGASEVNSIPPSSRAKKLKCLLKFDEIKSKNTIVVVRHGNNKK